MDREEPSLLGFEMVIHDIFLCQAEISSLVFVKSPMVKAMRLSGSTYTGSYLPKEGAAETHKAWHHPPLQLKMHDCDYWTWYCS